MNALFRVGLLAWALAASAPSKGVAVEATDEGMAFFETKIRPVLVQHCYSCHSAEASAKGKLQAGLALDTRQGVLTGGESGPAIIAGNANQSLLIAALRYQTYEMPPTGKLPDAVIADFVRWIDMGASDPRTTDPRDPAAAPLPRRQAFAITDQDRQHWAFQPIRHDPPPEVKDLRWCQDRLDRFVAAKRETTGLPVTEPANKHALLRRASFGLTGLPPTPEEIAAFVADDSPKAFERSVDRMLASPAFGVHWARHWLDGVRYASDVDKTGAYRDWVVRAFNEDLAYDRFVQLQLAGDLLPARQIDVEPRHRCGASMDGITATGMLALAIWEQVALDLAVAEIVDSQIDVVGRHLLGLTLACARCHDHKFDPISTADYYALAGIFFSSHIATGKVIADGRLANEVLEVPLLTAADAAKNRQIDAAVGELNGRMATISATIPQAAKLQELRDQIQDLDLQIAKSMGAGKKPLIDQMDKLRKEQQKLIDDQKTHGWVENPPELMEIANLRRQADELSKTKFIPPTVIAVQEGGVPGSNRERIGDAPIYLRGEYRREGPIVPRRFPEVFANHLPVSIGSKTSESGRVELAQWITSADHPLTARVMVNRVWQRLFGSGIVRTPDNFGRLGEPPTNPELLDHLASRLVSGDWSVKRLIRAMVLSSTYQQASVGLPESVAADPDNRAFGRMSPRRLTYEEFRDALLLVGDQLSLESARPPGTASGNLRTLYGPIERRKVDVTSSIFDGPDPKAIVSERAETTSAPQALFLMNNPLVAETARRLADRVQRDAASQTDSNPFEFVWLTTIGRPPTARESEVARAFVARTSWTDLIHVLLCTNEFTHLD